MQSIAAAVTMVRDDAFFLEKWVEYYGGQFGRHALYVINHGHEPEVARIAEGCNLIGIPGEAHKNFDVRRWRLLNNLVAGLRQYYKHVIVGDVDEYVVMDPERGTLIDFLTRKRGNRVLTPLGLEVVHRVAEEPEGVRPHILGPRRHVQLALHYSKPCVVSTGTHLSRGGHFADYPSLEMPPDLHLFHMKWCDYPLYGETMDRRNAMVASTEAENFKDVMIGRHWFASERLDDENFRAFAQMPVEPGFDFKSTRQAMHDSWKSREGGKMWQFDRPDPDRLFTLPERFFGIL